MLERPQAKNAVIILSNTEIGVSRALYSHYFHSFRMEYRISGFHQAGYFVPALRGHGGALPTAVPCCFGLCIALFPLFNKLSGGRLGRETDNLPPSIPTIGQACRCDQSGPDRL